MPVTAQRDRAPARTTAGRTIARVLLALVLTAGVLLPAVLPSSPAVAGTSCDGVTVRVERPGSTVERCTKGMPENGLDALTKAGFRYTDVSGQPGFVCTIDGYPDPCNGAPADAYWSYWHAEAGATSWTYATRGGASRTPAPGTHDAWVFGAGSPPSSPPPAPSTSPSPSPTPTPSPSPSPSPSPAPSSPAPSPSTGGSDGGSSGDGAGSSDGSGEATTDDRAATRPRTDDSGGSDGDDAPRAGGDEDGDQETTPDEADGESTAGEQADDERDDERDDEVASAEEDEDVRQEALEDTVTIEAPGSGRAGAGAAAGALLVVGLGVAGLLRARGRRGDLDGET